MTTIAQFTIKLHKAVDPGGKHRLVLNRSIRYPNHTDHTEIWGYELTDEQVREIFGRLRDACDDVTKSR